MDDIDRAQGVNEDFQAFALQQHRLNREPTGYTGTHCIDCEEEIPEERRQAVPGCLRCLDCQSLHEHWRPL